MKTKFLTAMLLVLLSSLSVADSLYIGGKSIHWVGDYDYNSDHNTVAYEHGGYVLGYFKNSYHQDTVFTSKVFKITEMGYFDLNLHAGLSYGYSKCLFVKEDYYIDDPAKVCPAIVPELVYTRYKVQPTLMLMGGLVFTFKINL